jgi:hypothetical protein
VRLHGDGTVAGLIQDVTPRGQVVLLPRVHRTLSGEDHVQLDLTGFRYESDEPELSLVVPAATLKTVLRGEVPRGGGGDRERRSGELDVTLDRADLTVGEHQLEVEGLADQLHVSLTGEPLTGAVSLTHHLEVRAARQDWAPIYPIGQLAFDADVERVAGGGLRVGSLRLDNARGGTHFELHGALDHELLERKERRLARQRGLSLAGRITQQLDRLDGTPADFRGSGTVALELGRAESADLSLFHTEAALRIDHATIDLPRRGLRLESVDAQVPVVEELILGERGGPTLVPSVEESAYRQLRFADQHPFLGLGGPTGRSFLAVGSITTPAFSAGPLAGNLRIDRNVFSLDQLEVSLRGGRVTGQSILAWRGLDSTVQLRVRASHIQASHGEPFDGNAAVTISLKSRSIDGRAEIIRLGKRHLLDLLDVHDPHHSDVPTNRLRKALGVGYPGRVRLLFDRGFASLLVMFGGIASLVRVDEIRGIPTGPLIDKVLGSLNPPPATEEAP